ncbi:MAG: hypothetical protein NC112_09265 [Oxalobacter formigenes]|nr:hypothetical protein [Oxalobacter formigenes]
MARVRTIKVSFAGGEISPEMLGRIEDGKYQSGLAKCRNFIPLIQGNIRNRPGLLFVREVKDSLKKVRLISFTFSTSQTMIIEMGPKYFRFHTMGQTLIDPATGHPYEVASPYEEADLFEVNYVQSADVMTLCHVRHPPMELRRYGPMDWRTKIINFGPEITAPAGVSAVSNSKGNEYQYTYGVTAIHSNGVSESVMTASNTVANNIYATGAMNTVTWKQVAGASRYRVYLKSAGMFGYIGETTGTSFIDDNIAPDMGKVPPVYDTTMTGENNYPGAVSYFEQRRVFAGSINEPSVIWMTRPGTESDMSYSIPTFDDDRIRFRVNARDANTIRHIIPIAQLVLLTSSAEWAVTSVNSDAITPSSIAVRTQSYIGAAIPKPVMVNNAMLYVADRGNHVRELGYSYDKNGFITGDISIRSAHLFDGFNITDMAYSKTPSQIAWFISTSGKLLGLTYMPEQQVGAWHQHDTDGVFESCAVVAEGNEDVLYVVVRREINGKTVRYIERLDEMMLLSLEDAFFVDSGMKYEGEPAEMFRGLDHLEGKTVSILGDGIVFPQQKVVGGSVKIDHPCSKVAVGLPIQADLQTLPVVAQIDAAYGQGMVKNVNKVRMRVYHSSGIFAGPSLERLYEYKQRTDEPYGSPPEWKTQEIEIMVPGEWQDGGQLYVRQDDPLPLTILNLVAEIETGG